MLEARGLRALLDIAMPNAVGHRRRIALVLAANGHLPGPVLKAIIRSMAGWMTSVGPATMCQQRDFRGTNVAMVLGHSTLAARPALSIGSRRVEAPFPRRRTRCRSGETDLAVGMGEMTTEIEGDVRSSFIHDHINSYPQSILQPAIHYLPEVHSMPFLNVPHRRNQNAHNPKHPCGSSIHPSLILSHQTQTLTPSTHC